MSFKIMYKFKDDETFYTCYVTYDQYRNFKKLPVIQECTIVTRNEQDHQDYKEEMQNAINRATENSTSHIRKLSNNV